MVPLEHTATIAANKHGFIWMELAASNGVDSEVSLPTRGYFLISALKLKTRRSKMFQACTIPTIFSQSHNSHETGIIMSKPKSSGSICLVTRATQ